MLVDTLGLLLAAYVTSADLHDGKGARCLRASLAPLHPRLKKIWTAARVPWTGVGCLVPSGRWMGSRSGRAHAKHPWVQRRTSQMGGGTNIELDFSRIEE
jgi:hypothetical protein